MKRYRIGHIMATILGGMILLASACNNQSVSDQQAVSFLKYYAAGVDDNTGTKVIETSDGYAILGNFSNVAGDKDIFVVFTDAFGRQRTAEIETIGTNLNDHGHHMIRLEGGGYLICGTSYTSDYRRGYLVNISNDGDVLWERNYGGYQELEFRHAALASDGNIIITGYSRENTGDLTGAIIYKVEPDGDSLWCKTYPLDRSNVVGEAIMEVEEGVSIRYLVLTTIRDEMDIRDSQIYMLNTNTRGAAQTSELIQEELLSGTDMVRTTAGRIFILGNKEDNVSRESSIFLGELELTTNGLITVLTNSSILTAPESQHASSFAPVEESGLAIGGWEVKPNDNDILFLQVDTDFNVGMRKTFGTKGHQSSQSIIYTSSDRGYALTGTVDLGGGRTSMLLKIDAEGELK